jgi:murein DD-endopeptidase MepM/ murein hydrolase activator NlpD
VRLFPATARQRLLAVATVGALGAGIVTSPTAQADVRHLRHQQAQAHHSVRHAKADLDEAGRATRRAYAALARSRAALDRARADLHTARAKVQEARTRLERTRRQLHRAEARLTVAEADLARGTKAMDEQKDTLLHTVTAVYEEGDPQLVGFLSLMNAQTPADLVSANDNNNVVLTSQDQALDKLAAARVLLKVQTDRLARARDAVETKRAEAHANLVLKRDYRAQAVDARNRVIRSVKANKRAWGQARRAREHDRRIYLRSKATEDRIHRRLLAEIAREQHRGGGYRGTTSGLLMPPVSGPITSPFGWRIHPIYHYWGLHDGDDFGAACGTPIWAAGNGTVMSEYYSSVWGNRLYLNLGLINGKNVTVIYNHLSAYRSHVGERVARGQVVGLIGTTGWSTGCHTHFTVMVNGTAVDPAPWLGLG